MIRLQLGRLSELLHRRTIILSSLLNIEHVNPVESIKLLHCAVFREDWKGLGLVCSVFVSRHLPLIVQVSPLLSYLSNSVNSTLFS